MNEQLDPLLRSEREDLDKLKLEINHLNNENQLLLNRLSDMKYAFALSELKHYKERESLMTHSNKCAVQKMQIKQKNTPNDDDDVIEVDGSEDGDVLSPIGEKEPLNHLMHRLEMEGMEKVQTLENRDLKIESLIKIMEDGEKEFMDNTGRRMTYGEMRSIYG